MPQTRSSQGSESEDVESAEAFRLLRSDIVGGALAAGERLRFVDLKGRYGLGISPLREALSRLAADRLVVQEVNRGFRVPPLSEEDFADIARLRIDLEGAAIEASVRLGGEAWEEAVLIAHHRLRRLGLRAAEPGDTGPQEWESRHRAFHATLIAACASPWTLHFCSVLHDQFDRYRRWASPDTTQQAGLASQHDMIVDAALRREPERARDLLGAHIADTARAVSQRLAARNAPGTSEIRIVENLPKRRRKSKI